MSSLNETFEQFLELLNRPGALNPAKSDPLFYFVHDPSETQEVAQSIPVWSAALSNEGWTVDVVSLREILWSLVDASGRWDQWLELEGDADSEEVNSAVRNVANTNNAFIKAVEAHVSESRPQTIVFLTDALLLHPFYRVHALESGLHDRIRVPTVLFYPGRRSGQYGLHYLGFYPVDGNYRATMVGGGM